MPRFHLSVKITLQTIIILFKRLKNNAFYEFTLKKIKIVFENNLYELSTADSVSDVHCPIKHFLPQESCV